MKKEIEKLKDRLVKSVDKDDMKLKALKKINEKRK